MADNFTRIALEKVINIDRIITLFYLEFPKDFSYDGERHDFWEMVYIDKGEMLCCADQSRFLLKSGEMTFHKPGEFHSLTGNQSSAPNASIITFECNSRAMKFFEGKIFRLTGEERALLSNLFEEGLSCYELINPSNPLSQNLKKRADAPFGSSQMTKNLLEAFLIKLCRHTDVTTKQMRRSFLIDGVDAPYQVKELLDVLQENLCRKLTIRDIAQQVGKSESAVKQLFATYRRDGIIRYFNTLKIKEAKRLLREGSYTISQISDHLGFDTPQYFSKCFRSFVHMSPSEYKRSIIK